VEQAGQGFADGAPLEADLLQHFKVLREEKKMASSSLWVIYSYLNTVLKNRYGMKMQAFPRITTLLKSYDTDVKRKAAVFDSKDIQEFVQHSDNSPYWLVRKVRNFLIKYSSFDKLQQISIILAYFGGLRHTEVNELKIEKLAGQKDGILVTHSRVKQRSDKRETRFLVPSSGPVDYAAVVQGYLNTIKSSLGVFAGRPFFRGTPSAFFNQPLGKNIISKVPCEMATILGLENSQEFTFHSLRRSSATAAADGGASAQQLMDFFGWANANMPQEYVSSSKVAVKSMAERLQGVEKKIVEAENPSESSSSSFTPFTPTPTGPYVIQNAQKVVIIENFNSASFTM
jgi:integrase